MPYDTYKNTDQLNKDSRLAREEAQGSFRALIDALKPCLSNLSQEKRHQLDRLLNQALADEYESGWATGYCNGYRLGRRHEREGRA